MVKMTERLKAEYLGYYLVEYLDMKLVDCWAAKTDHEMVLHLADLKVVN